MLNRKVRTRNPQLLIATTVSKDERRKGKIAHLMEYFEVGLFGKRRVFAGGGWLEPAAFNLERIDPVNEPEWVKRRRCKQF